MGDRNSTAIWRVQKMHLQLQAIACSHSPRSPRCLSVAVRWQCVVPAWLAARPGRALAPGGRGQATLRAGSYGPPSCVITQSCTDVHSSLPKTGAIHGASPRALVLPCLAGHKIPARATRRV